MNKKHTLVVVDVQRDFYHPTGSLYVDGGLKVVDNITKYIINHSKELDKIIFTINMSRKIQHLMTHINV